MLHYITLVITKWQWIYISSNRFWYVWYAIIGIDHSMAGLTRLWLVYIGSIQTLTDLLTIVSLTDWLKYSTWCISFHLICHWLPLPVFVSLSLLWFCSSRDIMKYFFVLHIISFICSVPGTVGIIGAKLCSELNLCQECIQLASHVGTDMIISCIFVSWLSWFDLKWHVNLIEAMQKSIENHLPLLCLLFLGRARVKIEFSDQNNLR